MNEQPTTFVTDDYFIGHPDILYERTTYNFCHPVRERTTIVTAMPNHFKKHTFYICLVGAYMLLGGAYLLLGTKEGAILFFSERRSAVGDIFFRITTLLGEAYPYIIVALAALAVRLRYTLLVAATGILVMLTSFSMKSFFQSDRPFTYFKKLGLLENINLVQGVELHTGATSLPSGHAMSAFALYGLLAFLLATRKRTAAAFFAVALAVALSRVYLVQHFWRDVYWGAIVGTLLAMLVYAFHLRFEHRPDSRIDRPLIKVGRSAGA